MLIDDSTRVFDEAYRGFKHFILAYSGGKDSTAVAILLHKWVKARGIKDLEVTLLHNDTLSEIDDMEAWARGFMGEFSESMLGLGVRVNLVVTTPPPTDTFYWRVLVRGYPAPTFNFRWCVDLLKVKSTRDVMGKFADAMLITGLRDDESGARAKSMRTRFGACQPGNCLGAYFTNGNDLPKAAPIRFWSTEDVWAFLKAQRDFDVSKLIHLYLFNGNFESRYGCWHCTLAKVQQGLYIDEEHMYIEAIRLLYRAISDTQELREVKDTGYSKLGPLNALGRALMLNLIRVTEQLAGKGAFYGLHETKVDGYTLHDLFYDVEPREADDIIRRADNTGRMVPVEKLRNISQYGDLTKITNKLKMMVRNKLSNDPFKIIDKVDDLLDHINS